MCQQWLGRRCPLMPVSATSSPGADSSVVAEASLLVLQQPHLALHTMCQKKQAAERRLQSLKHDGHRLRRLRLHKVADFHCCGLPLVNANAVHCHCCCHLSQSFLLLLLILIAVQASVCGGGCSLSTLSTTSSALGGLALKQHISPQVPSGPARKQRPMKNKSEKRNE